MTGKQTWQLDEKSLIYKDKEWGEEKADFKVLEKGKITAIELLKYKYYYLNTIINLNLLILIIM